MNPKPPRRRPGWWLAAVFVLAVGAGILWRWWTGAGPEIGGHSLSRWITRPDRPLMDLVDAAPNLGPDAIPILTDLLEWRPSPFDRFINDRAYQSSDWIPQKIIDPFRTAEADDVRAFSGYGLALMGTRTVGNLGRYEGIVGRAGTNVSPTLGLAILAAAPGDPRCHRMLHRLLTNPLTTPVILPALRRGPRLPPEVLPDLLAIITNRLPGTVDALELLPQFGTNAAAAAPAILRELSAGMPASRSTAGMHRLRYVPLLELMASLGRDAVLPHRDTIAAWSAEGRIPTPHNIIRVLGPAAAPWEKSLREEFDAPPTVHPVPLDRMLVAVSLAAIAGQPTNAIPELLRALRNRTLIDPTADYGPLHPRFQLSPLGPLTLNHRDAAVWILGEIGPGATNALPAIRAARAEEAGWMPVLAAWAVWRINGDAREAIPVLAESLGALDPYRRYLAMAACEELGPDAAPLRQAMDRARKADARLGLAFP